MPDDTSPLQLPSVHGARLLNRRGFLGHATTGLGSIALASLLQEQGLLSADESLGTDGPNIDLKQPYVARPGHFKPAARNVLVIQCVGALSQIDTFDYKPELYKLDGQPLPGHERLVSFQGENGNVVRPLWEFKPRGQCGKMISELTPHIAELADEMCFIHSLTSKSNAHGPGESFMSTGFTADGFPGMGAWITYALGTENQDLPAFVAIEDPRGVPQTGANNWNSGFLPAAFQGTPFSTTKPIRYLTSPAGLGETGEGKVRDTLRFFNERHASKFPGDAELSARVASYELAARMQMSVPEATSMDSEPDYLRTMYGADDPDHIKAKFARNCILARRLIERGVRFVQLFNGAYASGGAVNWDAHNYIENQYNSHANVLDQPVAALLKDLKQRGLLEHTLVVFCTEFGRMPTFQKGSFGRDHNARGFTCWLAGAGVKSAFSYGATDEFGFQAVDNVVTVHDFHATILHLLGLDHERLTFYHNGIYRRLTDVHGSVIRELLV